VFDLLNYRIVDCIVLCQSSDAFYKYQDVFYSRVIPEDVVCVLLLYAVFVFSWIASIGKNLSTLER